MKYKITSNLGIFLPRDDLPSTRDVSLAMIGTSPKPSKDFTALLMSFGQFISHDTDHVPVQTSDSGNGIDCCNEQTFDRNNPTTAQSFLCIPVEISPNDPMFQQDRTCMNVIRSVAGVDIDCEIGPYQQVWDNHREMILFGLGVYVIVFREINISL